jgi:hypothetical protein
MQSTHCGVFLEIKVSLMYALTTKALLDPVLVLKVDAGLEFFKIENATGFFPVDTLS